MSKELFISTSPHETKVAVLEDDQLVEVYFERDTDVGLVGGIYKGRVSRVLPGMQSAFVDIGLDRDAFLYVSDYFLEDHEEYDKIFEEAEARAPAPREDSSMPAGQSPQTSAVSEPEKPPATAATPVATEEAPEAPASQGGPSQAGPGETPAPTSPGVAPPPPPANPSGEVQHRGAPGEAPSYRRPEHRGRRRRRGRPYDDRRFAPPRQDRKDFGAPHPEPPHSFEVLPGELLAKYHRPASEAAPVTTGGEFGSHPDSSELAAPEPSERATPSPVPPAVGPEPALPAPTVLSFPSEPARADFREPQRPTITPRSSFESAVKTQAAATPSFASRLEAPTAPVGPRQESAPSVDAFRPPLESVAAPSEPLVAAPPPQTDATAARPAPAESNAGITSPSDAAPTLPASGESPAAPTPPAEGSSAPADRTYTFREPHHRPRFAPRRGRRTQRGTGQRRYPIERSAESARPGNHQHQPRPIAELLKEGQEILVQIAKEPLGTKGARITSHIALPGRYVVYMPTITHIGVSRKIASEEERLRLRNIILDNKGSLTGGFIVRTAGGGRSEEELKADLRFLTTLWNEIRAKAEQAKAPALIHRDLNLVQRVLRDVLSPDFKSVRVDNETDYERALDFVSRCQPALVGAVKLHTRDTPLFDEYGIQAEIEKALKPKVWLKSGGYIVINQTEALVAIDVNTGKYVGKTNRLEDTILKTNVDAVKEIVRQLRLRDLGGIIVIDFIDMDERRNRLKVVQALEEALRHDRAPTKIVSFNDFGLVAITRKRVKQSLERTLCEPCQYCSAAGWVKSATTVCYEILAEARKMAQQIEGRVLTLRVNPEVAHALKSRDGVFISELESLTHKEVVIKSDPAVHQERFEIF